MPITNEKTRRHMYCGVVHKDGSAPSPPEKQAQKCLFFCGGKQEKNREGKNYPMSMTGNGGRILTYGVMGSSYGVIYYGHTNNVWFFCYEKEMKYVSGIRFIVIICLLTKISISDTIYGIIVVVLTN